MSTTPSILSIASSVAPSTTDAYSTSIPPSRIIRATPAATGDGIPVPRPDALLRGSKGAVDRGGRARARTRQVDVPRAHREAVSLPNRWTEHDPHGNVEVGGHSLDDDRLLGVFLP